MTQISDTIKSVGSINTKNGSMGSIAKSWPPTKLKKHEDASPVIEYMPTRIPALAPAPERGLKRSMKSIRLDWLIRRPLMPISYIVWSPDL